MSVGADWMVGDWCRHTRHTTPCRIIDRQSIWNETVFRVWLPTKDAVIRARASDLAPLASLEPTENEILHTAAAAKLLDALEDNLLLAPIQSSVVPLPHQLHALNQAMSGERIRYLLADEVGPGQDHRGRADPARAEAARDGAARAGGGAEEPGAPMAGGDAPALRRVVPVDRAGRARRAARLCSSAVPGDRSGAGERDDNLWRMHDQVICSIDSVKPLEGRRGWSLEQLATYNRERFEDLVSASWDLVIVDESHRLGGSTEQVARYKLGAALAEAAPYLLLLSATPHQGKTDHFLRLIQLLDREAFPDEGSITRDRVRPFVIRTEKRAAIDAEGQPLFKPRMTRLQAVAWQDAARRPAAALRGGDRLCAPWLQPGHGHQAAAHRVSDDPDAAPGDVEHGGDPRDAGEAAGALLDAPSPQTSLSLFDDEPDPERVGGAGRPISGGHGRADGRRDPGRPGTREVRGRDAARPGARDRGRQGTDAKAEALLELIYRLQQEESDPSIKVLVFTEFVPTQAHVGGLSSRAAASPSPCSTAAWTWMPERRPSWPSRRTRRS